MSVGEPPDRLYAALFDAVQSTRLLGDSKTFVDAVGRAEPSDILSAFHAARSRPGFDLGTFVRDHFELPPTDVQATSDPAGLPIEDRIEQLWDLLTRGPDQCVERSSRISLPYRYVVPGGRFREVYYWDSYFTMLGLADSGRVDLIRDMVENFAYLIDALGFIPNGNRTYYCSRSQPPFFALMVDLLAELSSEEAVFATFLPSLKREYAFWMAGSGAVSTGNPTHRRVAASPGGLLNRYWDDAATPRQESYAEDVEVATTASRDPEELYRDLRAGAESGWDYSSRWFEDRHSLKTIRTTKIIPVDLNSLMYNLEATLARICSTHGDEAEARAFEAKAVTRRKALQSLFFDDASGMFIDLSLPDFSVTGTLSLAAAYPLFFGIATERQAERVAQRIHQELLKQGGWVTSSYDTGQQWDSPNGWAPLQWITYCGLERYGYHDEARAGASRWIENVLAVYRRHGRLLEKYDVVSSGLLGTGGEYKVQDGFGWTNAVLLRLMRKLRQES